MQDRQIKQLLVQYKGLKAYQFNARNKARNYTRGALIFQYAYKEYLELLMHSVDTGMVKLSQEETIFFNIFDKVIEGQNVSDSEKEAIKEDILYRYKTRIDNLQECDCNSMVERLRDYRD